MINALFRGETLFIIIECEHQTGLLYKSDVFNDGSCIGRDSSAPHHIGKPVVGGRLLHVFCKAFHSKAKSVFVPDIIALDHVTEYNLLVKAVQPMTHRSVDC